VHAQLLLQPIEIGKSLASIIQTKRQLKFSQLNADRSREGALPFKEVSMSVSGISSSNLFDFISQSVQTKAQQVQKEFQQLGQDLQSGNLSAAQSDFATLQQSSPQANSTSSSQSSNPIAQAFNQLSQDLQSGNVSAAQQDYTTIQQDFQTQAAQAQGHHHHGGGGGIASTISQEFTQLGQALQSGNLSSAQQAYSTLQQSFQQVVQNSVLQSLESSQSGSNSISVNV
jgi:outer membrane protein assembly factor BamD (BamD/ComL family)